MHFFSKDHLYHVIKFTNPNRNHQRVTKSSSSRHLSCFPLPEMVVAEILSWLPVASLFRFKSVCKSWHHLIDSSFFINLHLQHHGNCKTDYNLVLMDRRHYFDASHYGLQFSLRSGDSFELSKEIHLPNLSTRDLYSMHLVTCDGIVCLYYDHESWSHKINGNPIYFMDVFLWNPATTHFRVLPRPELPVQEQDMLSGGISCGFGFDSKTNDYKLVMIFVHNKSDRTQVQVYSLSTNSWRTIQGVPIDRVSRINSDPKAPYKSGSYGWFGTRPPVFDHLPEFDHCIVSFDFGTEKFGTMPLPDAFSVKRDPSPQFAILRGNIGCINVVSPLDDTGTHFEIWMLNEYGVRESWTNLYTVGPFSLSSPIGILKNWYFLLRTGNQLCLCDIVTEETKDIAPDHWFNDYYTEIATYKESLVSIKGRNGASNGATSEENSDWYNWLPEHSFRSFFRNVTTRNLLRSFDYYFNRILSLLNFQKQRDQRRTNREASEARTNYQIQL